MVYTACSYVSLHNVFMSIMQENLVCGPALNDTHTVEVCNLLSLSNCRSVSGIVSNLSEYQRRVIATFTDLEEHRNYLLTLNLLYNGGVTQQSHPLRIGKYIIVCCIETSFIQNSLSRHV